MGGAYVAHFAMYATLKIAHMARSGHVCATQEMAQGGLAMIDERYSTQRMLVLRRLTRAVSDLLHTQVREYLSALAPLLRPRRVFGDYVQGGTKEGLRGSEKALQELQSAYKTVAGSKPFSSARQRRAAWRAPSTRLWRLAWISWTRRPCRSSAG